MNNNNNNEKWIEGNFAISDSGFFQVGSIDDPFKYIEIEEENITNNEQNKKQTLKKTLKNFFNKK